MTKGTWVITKAKGVVSRVSYQFGGHRDTLVVHRHIDYPGALLLTCYGLDLEHVGLETEDWTLAMARAQLLARDRAQAAYLALGRGL